MIRPSVFNCSILPLSKTHSRAGNITVVEGRKNIPFEVKRVYYLYDIPGGESRGGHAHKDLKQLIVAVSGSFDVSIDDGINKRIINLSRPDYGLLLGPMIWRELIGFSSGAICLVLASENFNEKDYIRDYLKFKTLVQNLSTDPY